MEIPYIIFLILYLALLLVYFIFASFNIYHVVRFGFFDPSAKFVTILYLGSMIFILAVTAILVIGVDWAQTLSLNV